MAARNRRFFDDDDDDDEQLTGWTRNRRSNGTIARDRRNGVSRDPLSEVRAIVEDDWRETLDDDFHPITLALDMLDTSSLGRAKELDNFKKTNQQIEVALQSTVNAHYQGFNSSVGTYGQITGSISECQKQVRGTRDALLRAKVQLSTKREDLLEMSAKSQQFQSMIVMLRQIAELKAVPELLEQQLSTKHFLAAGETLNNAIYLANREDMLEIPALSDIRQYLRAQAVGLVEILVEELHNHLYLKSPYCDKRWKTYTVGQSELPVVNHDGQVEQRGSKAQSITSMGQLEIEQHQARQLGETDDFEETENRHPEADSLAYIVILTQALYSMGKLPYALEIMNQRLSSETNQTISRTVQEVRTRHRELQVRKSTSQEVLDLDTLTEQAEPLNDLLWTLFSKWDAVLQAHRALYDAVGVLQDRKYVEKRASTSNATAYDFGDVWLPLEIELKTILNAYLTTQAQRSNETASQGALNELFVNRTNRSRRSTLFNIGHASSDKDHPFANEEVELRDMLQRSVPGLLSEKTERATGAVANATEAVEPHVLLTHATPFNILTLLQPTMVFLERVKRIVPNSTAVRGNSLTAFLDEFLETVFYPQLTSAVDTLYRGAVDGSQGGKTGPRSIQQTTERVLSLVQHLDSLLTKIPYNREIYAQTVLSVYANYYQKCTAWLTALTANENPSAHLGALKLGAAWANRQQIRDVWSRYDAAPHSELALYEATSAELVILFEVKKDFIIRATDLIQDPSNIEGLVNLYRSVVLVEESLQQMLSISSVSSSKGLTLSPEAQQALQNLTKTFLGLRSSIILILRIELRTHIIYHLQVILSQGNYNIGEKASVVDTAMASMIADLQALCLPLGLLPMDKHQYVMAGLAMLINEVLVEDSSAITVMTVYGAGKLKLDISALQQNLRNLVTDPAEANLARALKFYDHFHGGASGLTEHAKATTLEFTPDQAAKLLTLIYSVDLANETSKNGGKEANSTKRKQLNEQIAALTAHLTAGV